eukprot:scaffold10651_cov112-Isochrysis_galbana.AAC.5
MSCAMVPTATAAPAPIACELSLPPPAPKPSGSVGRTRSDLSHALKTGFRPSCSATSSGVAQFVQKHAAADDDPAATPRWAARSSVHCCCWRACMIVLTVSTGNMIECSARPATEPATACCAVGRTRGTADSAWQGRAREDAPAYHTCANEPLDGSHSSISSSMLAYTKGRAHST